MRVVIVSRHEGTIEFLKGKFPEAKVIEHLKDINEIPEGALVLGNLPLDMIKELMDKRNARFVLVTFREAPRGKELSKEEVAKLLKLVEVKKIEIEEFKI